MKNHRQTILIVDDVKENVDILLELLKEHDLVTALDGKTAIEILQDEDIDLILLDIMMPKMDGFEACKRIKQNPKTAHIPIIFLSARDKSEDIQKGFELGAVDYITKPFNPSELFSRTSTHLKLRAYEKNLEKRVQKEIEKNFQKQQMIHQQSKQAALGELLMHIAHQWKQPLTSLSSINLLNRIKIDKGVAISSDELLTSIDKADNLIRFMSNTVDTFKDFYRPSTLKDDFSLHNAINQVLSISNATLEFHNIEVLLESSEEEMTYGNVNEFTQVIFSIINNAREIFYLREIQNPQLTIKVYSKKVIISDNAGGVDDNIIESIFLPFHSGTNGDGIGLYIAKEIVEKNGGIISVTNGENCAIFSIKF